MTLRSRAMTLIAVTVLGGVVLFALSAFAVVRSGYRELGRTAAQDRVDAVGHTIEDELVRLRRAASPLASSVNAVAFAQGSPEGEGFALRVDASALGRYDVDAIVVLDGMGSVVHSVTHPEAPTALVAASRNPVLRVTSLATWTSEGILMGESGPAIVLARAITGPASTQVPAGTLVFLRDLSDPSVTEDDLGLTGVTFRALSDHAFVESPLSPNRRRVDDDGNAEAAYTDAVGRTVLEVEARVPGSIREAEAQTLRRLVVLSMALAAGVGLTLLVWFERRLLSRLTRLTGLVTASSSGADRPAVELGGDDELSTLAERIETTLRSLETTDRDLRSANTRLEEAAEMKNEFISVVSHELRTPLTSILGFTETLRARGQDLPPERTRHFLDRMSVQTRNLDRMVEELLVLSRMNSGRMRHEPEEIALVELTREVVRSLPPGEPITVAPAAETRVVADPDHLRRILTNYLENARKYGAPPIEVTTVTTDDVVTLRVRDHGPGVTDDFVDQLFEPFTQASGGTRRTSRGVGLGLSIVRALAEINGGAAWYEAGDPGAVFAVSLPALVRLAEHEPATPPVEHQGALRP